jgi:predicted membrane-bound dolichyl-phosphate-mannose-protein mannosyltransferase
MLPFLPLYLGCSYLLAKKVFKKQLLSGSVTAIIAATPFLLSEYGQIYLDLPQATLVIAALTAQVYKKNRLAVALLTLATLTKLTAIMALPMLVFLSWKQNKKRNMYGKRLHYGSFRLLQLYSGFTTTTHIPIIG